MGKIFIIIGVFIFIIGLMIQFGGDKLGWFGNLYGDFKIIRSNYSFYFPLTSMLLVSFIISIVINLLMKLFK